MSATSFKGQVKCDRCGRVFLIELDDGAMLFAPGQAPTAAQAEPGSEARRTFYRDVLTEVAGAMGACEKHLCPKASVGVLAP